MQDYLDVLRWRSQEDRIRDIRNEFHWTEMFYGLTLGFVIGILVMIYAH